MTVEYGALLAQVLPVLALALILETRSRISRRSHRAATAPRGMMEIVYLFCRHGVPLIGLLVAEAASLLAAQGFQLGTGGVIFCTSAAIGGFFALIWEPIYEMVADTPDRITFVGRLREREPRARVLVTVMATAMLIGAMISLIVLFAI